MGTGVLSEDDLSLVNALQIYPRLRWSDAGPILNCHPTTLAHRWERLTASGDSWVVAHSVGAEQQDCLAFIDVECDLDRLDAVTEQLCTIPAVISADMSARNRDLMLTVQTEGFAQLTDGVLTLLPRVEGIRRFQTSICTKLHQTGDRWQLNSLSRTQQSQVRSLRPNSPHISEGPHLVHPAITAIMSEDGRATAQHISNQIGMHPTTAQRHINRIIKERSLIFRCEIAQRASGFPITCQWFGRVPAGRHETAAAALADFPELRLCASTTGSSNFMITMWLRSVDSIMEMEHRLLRAVPELSLDECAIALNIVKRVGRRLSPTGQLVTPQE
ncbi:Lrp/AsnC ligand binding domain-containing protein [Brevibacterium aurantiacum]|uniref:Lrp/AsnC ligand binding domain-containing protein n=1 Tax=Brevibacterium aurantiacum TaxID=273384 RepID=UPI001866BD82|nr:Lrp/AsnC ligand binding domain-containing protein [Brevibacterium aurantiacum]